MTDLPSLLIKSDPALGRYICAEAEDADEIRECLEDNGIRFVADSEQALRLAEPGRRTFVFGAVHPAWLRSALVNDGFAVELADGTRLPEDSYAPPLDRLLKLGRPPGDATSVDCAALGLERAHIPELIRMATDAELNGEPTDSPIAYAPIHAWRALGQLRAEEAIVPLLGLLRRIDEDQDDWVGEDLPEMLAEIGPAAIPAVTEYLADASHGEWARVAATSALESIVKLHPDSRTDCVARLSAQLARFDEQSQELNASLVLSLVKTRAVEALAEIERAFASGRVDESVNGDWEDAQIELGLKTTREHPAKPNRLTKWREEYLAQMAMNDAIDEVNGYDGPGEPYVAPPKVGRNDQCPCGSGKKFKKCCGG